MSADIIWLKKKLYILTFVKVVDLDKIFVMFNMKKLILIEHVKRIDYLIVIDRSIREMQIKIQYDI